MNLKEKYEFMVPRLRDLANGMYPHEFWWVKGMAEHVMKIIEEDLEYNYQSSQGDAP